jgi:hypothetical protein
MSGPHLSDAARYDGPTWQRTVVAWLPRAAPLPRLKATVGTVRRASRQCPPDSRPALRAPSSPRACRPRSDRLANRAVDPTASPTPPPSRPEPRPSTPRRCLHAGEPPFPAVSRAPVPSSAAEPRCAGRCRGPRQRRAYGPRLALCIWAERGFGPVAPD